MLDTIDSVFLAVPDLDAASRPYERLGLRLDSPEVGRRTLVVGGPGNLFAVHFLAETPDGSPLAGPVRNALAAGRGLFAVGLRVRDLEASLGRLASAGFRTATSSGSGEGAWLSLHEQAGTDLVLVRHDRQTAAAVTHLFPLKRLDHLAIVAPDLEARTRFWADVLGVLATGEVTTPAMVIRQLRVGDAVLELLGPASPDSPIWKRPPGLVSMASWEVEDLEAAVVRARAAGFTVPDPAPGVLPGTRVTTIQGSGLGGVNMQLLEYV